MPHGSGLIQEKGAALISDSNEKGADRSRWRPFM